MNLLVVFLVVVNPDQVVVGVEAGVGVGVGVEVLR